MRYRSDYDDIDDDNDAVKCDKLECEFFVKNLVSILLKKINKTFDENHYVEILTNRLYSEFIISEIHNLVDIADGDDKIILIKKFIHISICEKNLKILKYFLEKYNFAFTQFELKLAVCGKNILIITELLNHKIKPNNEIFLSAIKYHIEYEIKDGFIIAREINNVEIMKLLLEYGYKITQKDFISLAKKFIYIKNFKNFGLQIDNNIKKICGDSLFFPYNEYKFSQEHHNILFSKLSKITDVKKAIKKFKIKPDNDSLMNACNNKNISEKIINLLINEYKIIPTQDSLYLAIKNSNNTMLTNMLNKMKVLNEDEDEDNNDTDTDNDDDFNYTCFVAKLYG
jgi:hypothetical protein